MPTADRRTMPCPQCGQPVEVELWQLLDLGRKPDLRRHFLQGEINTLRCANCGATGVLGVPLVVHDPANQRVIFFIPDSPQITPQILGQLQTQLGQALMQALPGRPPNYLFSPTLCRDPGELAGLLAEGSRGQPAEASETGENIPQNLHPLLQELAQPARSLLDRPRRVELCRRALNLVKLTEQPQLWAALQFELGNNLTQNPQGGRAENLEQAIAAYQQALEVRTRQAMPVEWAKTMGNLAIAYSDRIRGERAENLEQAIAAYQQVLEVMTRQTLPVAWAQTMMNLANAYYSRIRGERAENLEQAIAAYQQALEVTTRQAMPIEWAQTMMNLANAYYSRIRGERAENLEQAIAAYQQALEVTTRQAMPIEWAKTMMNLANAYSDRIRGELAENLEQAITACQQALEVYTRQAMPIEWAQTMGNLANAYRNRIRGERAENLEQAIAAYQQALEVRTRQAMPIEWAQTMMDLADAYSDRIRGERAENLEQAIAACQQALEVRTRQAMPLAWAQTMDNLANAYLFRIRGERAENLEQAIAACQQALEVMTRQAMPVGWAAIMMNLANAYSDRIRGERAENLEQAIAAYQQVLEVRTRQAMPLAWAQTMGNLANVYYFRIQGERAENLEQAIAAYQQALEVMTRQAMPVGWAAIMMNLANAYSDRIRGERAENLEQAIAAYQQALEVTTRQAMPVGWATTMMNLAVTYYSRIRGERAENLEQAIATYQQVLEVMTRQTMPVAWAKTMMNLANAYSDRTPFLAEGERAENQEQAIAAYQQALTIYTLAQLPVDYRQTNRNLGNLLFGERRWTEAGRAYQNALQAGQLLLAAAYTETGRRAEIGATAELYARLAYALLRLDQPAEALTRLEQGKTRLLTQTLALQEADLSRLPPAQQATVRTLREAIRNLEAEMRLPADTPARRDDRLLAQALEQSRQRLSETIEAIRAGNPDFMPTGLDLPDLLALIPVGGALVAPLVTSQGSAVFVVLHGTATITAEHVIRLDDFTDVNLNKLLVGTEDEPGWLRVYLNRNSLDNWFEVIETTAQTLWRILIQPVHERLRALGLPAGAPILVMPQGGLGLLPLHAAWREVNGQKRTFLDDYTITYAPSGYALDVSRRRLQAEQRRQRSLLAVINPTEDLTYTPVEGEAVATLFDDGAVTALLGKAATPEAIRQAVAGCSYLHFSCHGFYHWGEAMHSGLLLANGEPLTLADIISRFNLDAARLVTLSACETGLTEFQQSPDEYIGLPAGFLQAGAPGVVSTLWAVNDLSTMLLMERFYQNHLQAGLEIAEALRQAQLWLRDVTAGELAERFSAEGKAILSGPRMAGEVVSEQFRRFATLVPDERPFVHPYHWAAFTFSGA